MSPREKKLLIFFGVAGFIILNFLAFNFYQTKKIEVERQNQQAQQKLDSANMFSASREQVTDQMEWLEKYEPEPAANQDVQIKLEQLCKAEATATGLTIKTQKLLPSTVTEGLRFHRAKIQITVNGSEDALYRWFDRLNSPEQLRVASTIRLSPNTKDDTQIDCVATVEQWFVPPPA